MLVPLAIINHYKPTRHPANITLHELYPEGYHERDLRLPRDPKRFTLRNFFLAMDNFLKFIEKSRLRPFRKLALRKAERWMLERFEGTDGLAAIFPAMLNSLIALKAMGYCDDHPQALRAERELKKLEHETETSVRIEPCFLARLGYRHRRRCHARIRHVGKSSRHETLRRMVDRTRNPLSRRLGDQEPRQSGTERLGSLSSTTREPDVDDTAMVLLALRKIATDNPKRRDECFDRGMNWMLTFQCKDGGWASFDKDCTKSILEKVPFADHNAMLDPECADITARILELLGYEGYAVDNPRPKSPRLHSRSPGRRLVVWPLGRQLHLWHLAGVARPLGPQDQHAPGLAARRARMARKRATRGRRLGRTLQHLRRSRVQGAGPEHSLTNRLGPSWAFCTFGDPHRPSLVRGIEYLTACKTRTARGPSTKPPAPVFPACFI